MNPTETQDVTGLIQRVRQGDHAAESVLIGLVYPELRCIAGRLLAGERSGHTLQTTDLVHEAYLRMVRSPADWHNRIHFFAIASQVMRHVLVDYARNRLAQKRGGGGHRLELIDSLAVSEDRLDELILFEDLLKKLEQKDLRVAQIVIYRFYGGMAIDEIAAELDISPRTVKREWYYARAWLQAEIDSQSHHGPRA